MTFLRQKTSLNDLLHSVIVISGDRHEFASSLIRNSVLDFSISVGEGMRWTRPVTDALFSLCRCSGCQYVHFRKRTI